MPSLRDKITGMMLGVAVGDALGLVVENWSREGIAEKYPDGIKEYKPNARAGGKIGVPSDDWQLTKCVGESIIRSLDISLSTQADEHIRAMQETTDGWGSTTKEACRALANGVSALCSGINGSHRGKGNGCAIKISPVAALAIVRIKRHPEWDEAFLSSYMNSFCQKVMRLAFMTHNTVLAAQSAVVQQSALMYCLSPFCDFGDGKEFDDNIFIKVILRAAVFSQQRAISEKHEKAIDKQTDLFARLLKLHNYPQYNVEKIIADFGGLSCFISNSLPGAYMFFLKNPRSIQALYDVINAGGDTDSTGSMVGALLGALNGTKIFPKALINDLAVKDEVFNFSSRFCEALEIPKDW